METLKNIGLIECSEKAAPYKLDSNSRLNGYHVKKVLVKRDTSGGIPNDDYPESEIVKDKQSIFSDNTIELVIVNSPGEKDLELVAEALDAGKQVRVL